MMQLCEGSRVLCAHSGVGMLELAVRWAGHTPACCAPAAGALTSDV